MSTSSSIVTLRNPTRIPPVRERVRTRFWDRVDRNDGRTRRRAVVPRLEAGSTIAGRYRLVASVGCGGVARVWKAVSAGRGGPCQVVAIKQLLPRLRTDRRYVQMFAEEARIGARMAHPNIVRVIDWCCEGEDRFIVLEWIDGLDLRELVADPGMRLAWDEAATIVHMAVRGLASAHEHTRTDGRPCPVLHRDVSPDNILIDRLGVARLADFGMARAADREGLDTAPGTIKGKVAYAAPEYLERGEASERADVYSMGVVLWEAIAGQRLHAAESDLDVYRSVMRGTVQSLEALAPVPRPVAHLIHSAVSHRPAYRPASARAFAHQLSTLLVRYAEPNVLGRVRERVRDRMDRR